VKILALHNLAGRSERFFELLTQRNNRSRPDTIVLTGSLQAEDCTLLKHCLIPVMPVMSAKQNSKPFDSGWPVCSPIAILHDNNLRLVVVGESRSAEDIYNDCFHYRSTLAIAPALTDSGLFHHVDKGFGTILLPEFARAFVEIENFFNSIQIRLISSENLEKMEEISFFW
jgi:hypothetical protein